MPEFPVSEADTAPRVFLSYSRGDLEFVRRLSLDLQNQGVFVDFDVADVDPSNVAAGISAEDEWWKRLEEMITRAQIVVFVVSRRSITSRVCDEEVAFAQANAKRIIPIAVGQVDFGSLPPRLATLNIAIRFQGLDDSAYPAAVDRLLAVIRLDVKWYRTAADMSIAAHKWNTLGRLREGLPAGIELQALQEWAARRPSTAPAHSELVLAYLNACQEAEFERAATFEAERSRYLELMEVVRPMLEAEIELRQSLQPSTHMGVRREQEVELERVKSLLCNTWHPSPAEFEQSTGADDGYAEIFRFPCCGKYVQDFLSTGSSDPPHQFRSDGCAMIPERLRHAARTRSNPFVPMLVGHKKKSPQAN